MPHVFRVQGYEPFAADDHSTLLELCEDQDIPMESACGGFATCNSCRVRVLSGADNLSPKLEEEEPFLDHDAQRLGCQATVHGPAVVRLEPGM